MKRKKDSKYPEDDLDLEVYSGWEAGPDHYDFKNKKSFDNRSVLYYMIAFKYNHFYWIADIS